MGDDGAAYVAFDTAKLRDAVAIAEKRDPPRFNGDRRVTLR